MNIIIMIMLIVIMIIIINNYNDNNDNSNTNNNNTNTNSDGGLGAQYPLRGDIARGVKFNVCGSKLKYFLYVKEI